MKQLLIATHNKAKLGELKFGLQDLKQLGVKTVSLDDLEVSEEPHETGKTFQENAEIKARFYGDLTKFPTISDDGGLVIPYLNNEPGVKSRRWLGREATDEDLINYTLLHLKGATKTDRIAYLKTCVAFYHPQINKAFFAEEKIMGHIAVKPSPRRIEGYPYRALFIVNLFNKYYDELTDEEHQQINHRLKALRRLLRKIKPFIIK